MNALSREVLRKFLKGTIITESNVRREGSEDEEEPERRGFRVGDDLRLGAIDTTNVNRNRGKKEKKKTIKKDPSSNNNSKYNEKKVRMHGKCMNM